METFVQDEPNGDTLSGIFGASSVQGLVPRRTHGHTCDAPMEVTGIGVVRILIFVF